MRVNENSIECGEVSKSDIIKGKIRQIEAYKKEIKMLQAQLKYYKEELSGVSPEDVKDCILILRLMKKLVNK